MLLMIYVLYLKHLIGLIKSKAGKGIGRADRKGEEKLEERNIEEKKNKEKVKSYKSHSHTARYRIRRR